MPIRIPFDDPLDCVATDTAGARPIHAWRPGGLAIGLGRLPPEHAAYLRAAGFAATAGHLLLLPGEPGGVAGAVLGLGDDRSLWTHGDLAGKLPEGDWALQPGDYDADAAALGFCLGAYHFAMFKPRKRPPARLVDVPATAVRVAQATAFVRDLINAPANALGPAKLADITVNLATRFGADTTLVIGEALTAEYPAIAAVGAGSDRPPVVARFSWRGSGADERAPLLSLCGKGVCFDSGGYDLKPSAGMLRMKKDMGGAALLLGLAALVMARDLPVRLEVRIGCVENMVSGRAFRPLDVLTTRRGLSVEVGNTDAEGRLVLCDLLAEASDARPDLLIDAATLTGAARVALGPDLPVLFCPDDDVANTIMRTSLQVHDAVWRLPLWDGYDGWLSSPVADLGNVGSKPMAGSIVAALFLQRFIAPGTNWLHFDTYAWNDSPRPGRPEGGEALGLRALDALVCPLLKVNLA